jgi:pyruvate carboxylase
VIVPYRRRLGKARDGAITPTIVALYDNALKLRASRHRSDVDQESVYEAEKAVDRALSVRLWQTSVFDVDIYRQPGDPDWERAAELRRQLDAALRARREAAA